MGIYDHLELPAAISLPGLERDPSTVTWQTKSIGQPAMRTFRISPDGRLLQEECHTEEVPEEERPYYGTERWAEPLFQLTGGFRRVHDGWSERVYTGVIRFGASVEGEYMSYRATFSDGRLVAIRQVTDDDGEEWIPIEQLGAADTPDSMGTHPSPDPSECAHEQAGNPNMPAYKRTGESPLLETARMYDVSIPTELLTETRREERYLQIIHLPDARGRTGTGSGDLILRGRVYELVVREAVTIEEHGRALRPVNTIVDRTGPLELEPVLRHVVERADSSGLPIYHEIVRLRPNHWTEISAWVRCPDCASDELTLVADLDGTDLTLACRACDARVTETERETMSGEWLHCPSCASGDVNVELSAPRGGVRWSCDDCRYDTMPGPIDWGYTTIRRGDLHDG